MAYVYKGKQRIEDEAPEPEPVMPVAAVKITPDHGTNAMYQRHIRAGEDACEQCSAAHSDYMFAYRYGPKTEAVKPIRTRAEIDAAKISETDERIESLEALADSGVPIHGAAIRAGWPSVAAAARALYRRGHPLAAALERARRAA